MLGMQYGGLSLWLCSIPGPTWSCVAAGTPILCLLQGGDAGASLTAMSMLRDEGSILLPV